MADVQRARRERKTWSLYEERRKPGDYEIVTHKLNYHFRRGPTPFELDEQAPLNQWYLRHREGSAFNVEDWDAFRDPARLTYRGYVELQRDRESYLDGLIDEFESRDHYAALSEEWVQALGRLYVPARFPCHVLQMLALYVSQMAPSSYITVAFQFQGADEMRRVQRIAYLSKAWSGDHAALHVDGPTVRRIWEEDEAWQPLRELLERALVAYDWGEALTALSLAVKPVCDALLDAQLSQLARSNGDELLALVADDLARDAARHEATVLALFDYAFERDQGLQDVVAEWLEVWRPRALAAAESLAPLFAQAPEPLIADEVVAAARARLHGVQLQAVG